MTGLGSLVGMFIDAHTGNPDPNNSVGGALGGMAGAFGSEMTADIVAFFSKPIKVHEVERLNTISEDLGPKGHCTRFSKDIKDHVNGKTWFFPNFSLVGWLWSDRFASPSSKEQSYVRGVLKDVKGKGSRSRKLADAVRSNIFIATTEYDLDQFTFDADGKTDAEELAHLG